MFEKIQVLGKEDGKVKMLMSLSWGKHLIKTWKEEVQWLPPNILYFLTLHSFLKKYHLLKKKHLLEV
jgi:hypothetical protein